MADFLLFQFSNPYKQYQKSAEYQRYASQKIAMPRKKSLSPAKMNLSFEGPFLPPGRPGHNRAPGANQRGNSGIGDSNEIPPVFDGPHRAEIEMVSIARRVFPPAVVGNHADKARFFGQVSGAVGAEYGFEADDRQNGNRSVRRYKSRTPLSETVGAGVSAQLQ